MKINEIAQWGYNKEVYRKQIDDKKRNNYDKNDKIEISKDARNLQANTSLTIRAKDAIKKTDDIRYDKIEEARERIRDGFYFHNEVSRVIIENIMRNLGIE